MLFLLNALVFAETPPSTHCLSNEQVVSSCETEAKARKVSLCAGWTRHSDDVIHLSYLQYLLD